jgi:hypothetical protein
MLTGNIAENGKAKGSISIAAAQPSGTASKRISTSTTTLLEVEQRSQNVLANADRLLKVSSPTSSAKDTGMPSIVRITKVSAPPSDNPADSPKRKAFAVLDNLVFNSARRNFSKPLNSYGALFGGALGRLLQTEAAPPAANASTHATRKQKETSEDSVLAELERRVEVYSQALEKTKGKQ